MKASSEQAERLHRFAHDLRNRLAGIQQVLGQLRGNPTDDTAELLLFAEQQFFKAMRATEDLLDDLHVDRSARLSGAERICLSDAVEHGIAAMRHRFERKNQILELDLKADLHIRGDSRFIEDLISALLSNASKFSHLGSPITVSLCAEGDEAKLTVTDLGIGMDTEDLAMVFKRYAWLKGKTTSGEAQGRSTLGRAKQWAELHGGSLSVSSAGPDQGSTFVLRLPICA